MVVKDSHVFPYLVPLSNFVELCDFFPLRPGKIPVIMEGKGEVKVHARAVFADADAS